MTPTNEMRKRKTPQNMMPPMMLVVSTLVDMAYTATVIRMMDKSFLKIKILNKREYLFKFLNFMTSWKPKNSLWNLEFNFDLYEGRKCVLI